MTYAILSVVHEWASYQLAAGSNCNPEYRAALTELTAAIERLRKFL